MLKKGILNKLLLIGVSFIVGSCSLLGIYFDVHTPKKAGKMPNFSEETILLGEMTALRSCFDVHYYDLAIDFEPSKKQLDGKVAIHAIAQSDFEKIQIDLHPNFRIQSLKEGNQTLQFERKERAVFIELKKKKGESFILFVDYIGQPRIAKKPPWKGGFVWKKDKSDKPWIGVACESDGASLWWPLKDHTADEPDSMRLHYTVPKGLVAVGNGRLEAKEEKGNKTTFNWHVSYPINTYNVTVYIGDFKLLEDEYIGINGQKLEMNHYVLPKSYEKAKSHFQQVKPILKTFELYFGTYPWYRDGFKLIESPYAGMEHQTAIAYGNGYKNDLNATNDYIMVHEVAHEWWGNSVTARDLSDVWIQEGFATYAEALFLEKVYGKNAADSHLSLYKLLIKNKYPVKGVEDRRWFHFRKGSDVYMKGAWILHTFRVQLENDELFFDILKSFATKYKRKLVDSQDFVNMVNEKTGKDYTWFFDHYLKVNEAPILEYVIDEDETIYYRWKNTASTFNDFVVIMVVNGKEVRLRPKTAVQSTKLTDEKPVRWNAYFKTNVFCGFEENKLVMTYTE